MSEAVRVKDLLVKFGDFKAVNHIHFSVTSGEIFGFLGANGAGKTTTIRVLCGLLLPTEGEVSVAGITHQGHESSDLIKAKVGYMSQKFTLYPDLTVGENLDFTASLRKLEKSFYLKRRRELFDFISFQKSPQTMVRDLPGGMKQQVSLAAALLHDPEIIFLDEPTAGVTSASREKFWDLIKNLSESGKTIFVTSHYMDEVEQCNRIALMRTGELIALDTPEGLKKTSFPHPLYELNPKRTLSILEIDELKAGGFFDSFEAYGLRFHASPLSPEAWVRFQKEFGDDFDSHEMKPTLEDVFIRLVEDKNR